MAISFFACSEKITSYFICYATHAAITATDACAVFATCGRDIAAFYDKCAVRCVDCCAIVVSRCGGRQVGDGKRAVCAGTAVHNGKHAAHL